MLIHLGFPSCVFLKRSVRNPAPKSRKSAPVVPGPAGAALPPGAAWPPPPRQPLSASCSRMTPSTQGLQGGRAVLWVLPLGCLSSPTELPGPGAQSPRPFSSLSLPRPRPRRGSVPIPQEQQAHCHAVSGALFLTAPSFRAPSATACFSGSCRLCKGQAGHRLSLRPPSCQGSAAGNILGISVTLTTRKLSTTSHLLYTELDIYRSAQDKILLVTTDHNPGLHSSEIL